MECIEWILTCPSNLRALSLCDGSENGIGDEGCQLLDCNLMRNLTSLNLNKQSIGNRGCHIIANSSHLTNLRTLKLPSNVFDNDGLKDLLEGSIMVNLTSLDLSDSAHCTNEGFQSLITSPNITNLKSLNLSGCKMKELVFTKPLVNLEELDLGFNHMTNITVNSNLCKLTRLDLSCNELTDTTCEHLFRFSSFKLTDIDMSFLPIGEETIQAIAYTSQYYNLTRLYITPPYNHYISMRTIFTIAIHFTMLTDLCLNRITMLEDDCRYIAQSTFFSNMTRLSLEECEISYYGVEYITSNKTELKHLFLSQNEIEDLGCHYIATSPFMIHLETLDISFNKITKEGCESLVKSSCLPRLSSLQMGVIESRRAIEMLKLYNRFDENCEIIVNEDYYIDSSDEEKDWWNAAYY